MENIQSVEWNYNLITNTKCSYQVILIDGRIMSVPLDETNSDYQAIQEWVAEGNTITDNGGGE
jgi:hypothetical protein